MALRRATRIVLWSLLGVLVALVIAAVVVLTVPAPAERWLQGRIVVALRQHYGTDVQLQNLHVTLIPVFRASADNFVLPNRGNPDLPPLITVKHLTMEAAPFQLLRQPVHISNLELDGLEIKVGPKGQNPNNAPSHKTSATPETRTRLSNFIIDRVQANGTKLYILRKDPSREPMLFDLRQLRLRSAGAGQPMTFIAQLTNPTPPGLIDTTGHFGPWNFDDPSGTKVDGHYNFQHADLSVFNGISGILSSVGDYSGVLHNIVVDGTTDVPNFQLDSGGQEVHLTTQFHATVDGTNGNTYLQPVKAHFLDSDIVTSGEIAGKPGQKGKTISLDVDIQQAHLQDVLALATKSQTPALTGGLVMQAKLDLPPGDMPVLKKMLLNGAFHVSDAHFNDAKVKQAIAELSRRGQGKPDDQSITDVAAQFAGDFRLAKSTLTFTSLHFQVPGAAAQMKGTYGLSAGNIDFVGDVELQATVSQTMSGAKKVLVAPLDPLFKKHGAGTYLPVSIAGTTDHPQLHLDWKKLF